MQLALAAMGDEMDEAARNFLTRWVGNEDSATKILRLLQERGSPVRSKSHSPVQASEDTPAEGKEDGAASLRDQNVANLLGSIQKLSTTEFANLMEAMITSGARQGYSVVDGDVLATRMAEIAVEFKFLPIGFFGETEEMQAEVNNFVTTLKHDDSLVLQTLAKAFFSLTRLLKFIATRLAPFLDRYDVDLIALMTEVNRSVGGRKRPGWSKLYAEWLIKEPRLKEWCSNPDVFRTTYHRLVKDGRVRLR